MNEAAFQLADRKELQRATERDRFLMPEQGNHEQTNKSIISDLGNLPMASRRGLVVDYLTGADQKIPHQLVRITFLRGSCNYI